MLGRPSVRTHALFFFVRTVRTCAFNRPNCRVDISSIVGRLPLDFASSGVVGKVTIFSTPIENAKNSVVEKVGDFARAINRKSGFVNRVGKSKSN